MTAYRSFQRTASEGASRLRPSPSAQEERKPSHPLLKLQGQVGNSVVARLVAQRAGIEEEEPIQGLHDPALAQRMGAPEEEEPIQGLHDPALAQRMGAPEEEEPIQGLHDRSMAQRQEQGEEEEIQEKRDDAAPQVGLEGGPVGSDIESRINSARGSGSGLDSTFRSKIEATTGESLEGVRVHTGAESDALNRSISAKAFTTGNDIFLRNDVSTSDHQTMAHEVAHVFQQRSMDTGSSGGMSVGAADSSYEHEADQFASSVLSGGAAAKEREEA